MLSPLVFLSIVIKNLISVTSIYNSCFVIQCPCSTSLQTDLYDLNSSFHLTCSLRFDKMQIIYYQNTRSPNDTLALPETDTFRYRTVIMINDSFKIKSYTTYSALRSKRLRSIEKRIIIQILIDTRLQNIIH